MLKPSCLSVCASLNLFLGWFVVSSGRKAVTLLKNQDERPSRSSRSTLAGLRTCEQTTSSVGHIIKIQNPHMKETAFVRFDQVNAAQGCCCETS